MSTPSVSGISSYAYAIKDLNKARDLGLGGFWTEVSAVQNGKDSDVVEIMKGHKTKAKELYMKGLFEAVRLYVKLKFNQFFSKLYENTINQAKAFGEAFLQKIGAPDVLKNGLDNIGQEMEKAIKQRAQDLAGVTDGDISPDAVNTELERADA